MVQVEHSALSVISFLETNSILSQPFHYFYDTYSYKYKGVTITGIDFEESNPTVYKFGIRIPVVVGYSIYLTDRISIAPFTGPEMSYSFAGAIKYMTRKSWELMIHHYSESSVINAVLNVAGK